MGFSQRNSDGLLEFGLEKVIVCCGIILRRKIISKPKCKMYLAAVGCCVLGCLSRKLLNGLFFVFFFATDNHAP